MKYLARNEWAHDGLAHSVPAAVLYSGCRRAASCSFVGEKDLTVPSGLESKSEVLNKRRNEIIDKKSKMSEYPETREEESGFESESVSSTQSRSGSSTDLAAPPTDELISVLDVKRRVRFADDCGKELFSIKVMSEPSHVPPLISPAVLRRFRGEDYENDRLQHSSWILSFPQPASEHIRFRRNIDQNKVANIVFEKRVFIRLTTNSWQSYFDLPAHFQQSSNKLHDTFTFDIGIPRNISAESRIEFCVCYVAGGQAHWDSNDGNNYVLLSSDNASHSTILSPQTPLISR